MCIAVLHFFEKKFKSGCNFRYVLINVCAIECLKSQLVGNERDVPQLWFMMTENECEHIFTPSPPPICHPTGVVPATIIGAGRVGQALAAMNPAGTDALLRRGQTVAEGGEPMWRCAVMSAVGVPTARGRAGLWMVERNRLLSLPPHCLSRGVRS